MLWIKKLQRLLRLGKLVFSTTALHFSDSHYCTAKLEVLLLRQNNYTARISISNNKRESNTNIKIFNSGFYKSTNLKKSHQVNSHNQSKRKAKVSLQKSTRVFVTTMCARTLRCSFSLAPKINTWPRGISAFLSKRNSLQFCQRIVANFSIYERSYINGARTGEGEVNWTCDE